jgi:hypothetical protein
MVRSLKIHLLPKSNSRKIKIGKKIGMVETVILIEIATGTEEGPRTGEIGKIGMHVLDVGIAALEMILTPLMIEDKGKDTLKVDKDQGLALVVLILILKMILCPNLMGTL